MQVILQVQAFTSNAQAADFLWKLVLQGNARDPGFAVMGPNDLRFCDQIPSSFSTESCQVIWNATAARNGTAAVQTAQSDMVISPSSSISSTSVSPVTSALSSTPAAVSPSVTTPGQVNIVSTVTVTLTTSAPGLSSSAVSATAPSTTVIANGDEV